MQTPIFITGIGTDVGKTVAAAIVTEALQADYWKPVQAGFADGTDSEWVKAMLGNTSSVIHPEAYRLQMPASPHIAARQEGVVITVEKLVAAFRALPKDNGRPLVIEGAGGLLVPLNEQETVLDLIKALQANLMLVSRNYLGSINHSLLTAQVCRQHQLPVLGWVFNDHFGDYQSEIAAWSGYPVLHAIPPLAVMDKSSILEQAVQARPALLAALNRFA
jgi:dethiobiotin synthetase